LKKGHACGHGTEVVAKVLLVGCGVFRCESEGRQPYGAVFIGSRNVPRDKDRPYQLRKSVSRSQSEGTGGGADGAASAFAGITCERSGPLSLVRAGVWGGAPRSSLALWVL
jgi:hypothetical protein